MTNSHRQRLPGIRAAAPATSLAVVAKCGACLAVLALLAVIGSTSEAESTARAGRSDVPKAAPGMQWSSAAAHRKEVFDERRARFLGEASEPDSAAKSPLAHAESPAP